MSSVIDLYLEINHLNNYHFVLVLYGLGLTLCQHVSANGYGRRNVDGGKPMIPSYSEGLHFLSKNIMDKTLFFCRNAWPTWPDPEQGALEPVPSPLWNMLDPLAQVYANDLFSVVFFGFFGWVRGVVYLSV